MKVSHLQAAGVAVDGEVAGELGGPGPGEEGGGGGGDAAGEEEAAGGGFRQRDEAAGRRGWRLGDVWSS